MVLEKTNKNVKLVQIILFIIGIITFAIGIYANGPRLEQFVINNISPDKQLKVETTAILNSLGSKIIVVGVLLVIFSLLLKYLILFWNLLAKKIQSTKIIEWTINSTGNLLSIVYKLTTKEKFLITAAIVILLGFLIPSIFLSPFGGFHVEV